MFVNESSVHGLSKYPEQMSNHNLKQIYPEYSSINVAYYTVTCLWHTSVPGFLQWRLEFSPGLVPVGFGVDKLALGPVFLPVLRVSPVGYVSTYDYLVEGKLAHERPQENK